ncbi:hypothetical protein RND59_16250 [Vibrio ruber]|uniref:hypothetical protein n=1 Tax=Vibrio ruber TaxID=184755 RepID=UPI002892D248|nr:hypothetical protein [Vibrio ruber]WNJ97682.1 hypothetical protein RND59_16250 [Vibrio ruber]
MTIEWQTQRLNMRQINATDWDFFTSCKQLSESGKPLTAGPGKEPVDIDDYVPSGTTSSSVKSRTILKESRGSLNGEPEIPPRNASPDMVRSIDRQNESAELLVNKGLDITHYLMWQESKGIQT